MPFTPPPPLPPFLDPLVPFQRRAYRLERGHDAGKRMHLVDHGPREGRPVLMVHGNPTWSFLWRKVIARLPELRRVAPDLLGFGLSDKLGRLRDHSVERHLDALEELVLALDLKGVVLVGQDWGGPLVAGLGARLAALGEGGRVAGLVLANTSVLLPARPKGTWFHRFARTPVVAQVAFRVLGFPLKTLHKTQGDPRSIEGTVARAYQWPLSRILDRAGPLALARMVPDSLDHPSVPALRRGEAWARGFQGPMALVWGERDPVLGRALAKHVEAFPRAAVTRTQAGHFCQEEVPDELAAAISDLATRAGAPASA